MATEGALTWGGRWMTRGLAGPRVSWRLLTGDEVKGEFTVEADTYRPLGVKLWHVLSQETEPESQRCFSWPGEFWHVVQLAQPSVSTQECTPLAEPMCRIKEINASTVSSAELPLLSLVPLQALGILCKIKRTTEETRTLSIRLFIIIFFYLSSDSCHKDFLLGAYWVLGLKYLP